MKKILVLALAFLFFSCGYMPISKVSNSLFDEKIYVEVRINQQDPRSSVFIADTLREVIINKLNKTPVPKNEADDIIVVTMENIAFDPIVYDENGYVVAYQARLDLKFDITFMDKRTQSIQTQGNYDFAISPNSTISDSARLEAMRFASSEALDELVSILAIRGQKNQ